MESVVDRVGQGLPVLWFLFMLFILSILLQFSAEKKFVGIFRKVGRFSMEMQNTYFFFCSPRKFRTATSPVGLAYPPEVIESLKVKYLGLFFF